MHGAAMASGLLAVRPGQPLPLVLQEIASLLRTGIDVGNACIDSDSCLAGLANLLCLADIARMLAEASLSGIETAQQDKPQEFLRGGPAP
jgi:hypothetical protein